MARLHKEIHEGHSAVGSRAWNVGRISRIVVMVLVAVGFILPIVGFIALAFRSQEGLEAGNDGFLGLGGMSWDNAVFSWSQITGFGPGEGGMFQRWMMNSLIVAGGGALIAVVTALPAGYAFARLRFRFRKTFLFATLLAMVMPNTVLVIPIFLEVNAINAVGQLWPVMIIMSFYPFGVYLAYIHFMTTMPHELVEAGCSHPEAAGSHPRRGNRTARSVSSQGLDCGREYAAAVRAVCGGRA